MNNERSIVLKISKAERDHLLSVLYDERRRGDYYGRKDQHERRQRRLIRALEDPESNSSRG